MNFENVPTNKRETPRSPDRIPLEREDLSFDKYEQALKLIEQVDLKTLNEIFDEIRKKSGVHKLEIVDKKRIRVLREPDESTQHGSYAQYHGIDLVADYLTTPESVSEEEFRNHMLSILIHEETHAAAGSTRYQSIFFSDPKLERLKSILKPVPIYKTGYSRQEYSFGLKRDRLDYFSEGVTDLIAEDVHAEYISRTGDRHFFSRAGEELRHIEGYRGSRVIVTVFIEMIADATDVPRDKVWEAVKQGYMSGLDLRQMELKEAFDQIFFKDFLGKIDSQDPKNLKAIDKSVSRLLVHAERVSLDDQAKTRIKRAYNNFLSLLDGREKTN